MTVCSLLPASTRVVSAATPTTAPPVASRNSIRREKRRGGCAGDGEGGVGSGASMRPRKMPDSGGEGKINRRVARMLESRRLAPRVTRLAEQVNDVLAPLLRFFDDLLVHFQCFLECLLGLGAL